MPRAHRHFLPDRVWHITHRCHEREFLLQYLRDRKRWLYWLFESRKRFGLCVLNYVATSNHVHLLVHDRGHGEITRSMQLAAGCTAQEYNRRKGRAGAFWEDRYHATAVDTDDHLARCMVYIDLNMVRAGAVKHPQQWPISGYREIQQAPQRYRIINVPAVTSLLGFSSHAELKSAHAEWVSQALSDGDGACREGMWSESLAVGGRAFVQRVKNELGISALHRKVRDDGKTYGLKESAAAYEVQWNPDMAPLSTSRR